MGFPNGLENYTGINFRVGIRRRNRKSVLRKGENVVGERES